ncbi:MAG: hypothetical protein KIS67_02210 [Verrucomicrobiae bacterium]|nr:hypothetical protein [Verrucomicrobiae bacterium]
MSRFTSAATSSGVAADVSPFHLSDQPERLLSPSLSSIPNGGEGGRRPGEEAAAAVVAPPTNAYPLHIVVLQEDEDLDGFPAEHGITATLKYRSINGFAALLPAAALDGLRRDLYIPSSVQTVKCPPADLNPTA